MAQIIAVRADQPFRDHVKQLWHHPARPDVLKTYVEFVAYFYCTIEWKPKFGNFEVGDRQGFAFGYSLSQNETTAPQDRSAYDSSGTRTTFGTSSSHKGELRE